MSDLKNYEIKYFEHCNCLYVSTKCVKAFTKNHAGKQLKRKYPYAIICRIKEF